MRRDRREAIWDDLTRPAAATSLPAPRCKVVTVFSAKGGSGRTTVATNLAAALADEGRREVCLLDLDLAFGDVAVALQLFPAHTIADALPLATVLDGAAVRSLVTAHSPGLSALVAPLDPGQAESIPVDLVATVIRLLREEFEYVVVDTPPAFDDHVLAAFEQSDIVALVAIPDVPGQRSLQLTLETMDLLAFPRERVRIVLNRSEPTSLPAGTDSVEPPVAARIPRSRDVPMSINSGLPMVLDRPAHVVSRSLMGFAQMVIDTRQPSEMSGLRHDESAGGVPASVLREQLVAHARAAARTRGLVAHVFAPEPSAASTVGPGLVQLCFEALASSSKHVGARNLWVSMLVDTQLVFRVENDGTEPVSCRAGSRRMRRLTELAGRVGAYLAVAARPGGGTVIEVTAV